MIQVKKQPTQKHLSSICDKANFIQLLDQLKDKPKDLAWLQSGRAKYTATWLRHVSCSNARTSLDPTSFQCALRCRLLLPVSTLKGQHEIKCGHCTKVMPAEESKYHALECTIRNPLVTERHNCIRDIIFDFLGRVLPAADVGREVQLKSEKANRPDKRTDLTVTINGLTQWIDVTVGTPTSQMALAGGSAQTPGRAARLLAESKDKEYLKSFSADTVSSHLVPFAVESTGRLGNTARSFVDKICRIRGVLYARDQQLRNERLYFMRRLSTAIQHWNSRFIDRAARITKPKIQLGYVRRQTIL